MRSRQIAQVVVASVLASAGSVVDVHAQQPMRMSVSVREGGAAGGASGMISARSLERIQGMLKLTDEQKTIARELHDGYKAAYQQASAEMRDVMSEAARSFQDTNDPSVFQEKVPAARKKFEARAAELEKNLLNDLRSVLTKEQDAQWNSVVYLRRREKILPTGTLSGESVDLVEVVAGLKLPDPDQATLASALADYTQDLDRALQRKEKTIEETPGFKPGEPIDVEAMQKMMAAAREAGTQVREVNMRHARQIASQLPEQRRSAFEDALKRASFPRVYRPSRVMQALDAAAKFDDLEPAQRDAIKALADSYGRDLGSANERWVAAIQEQEAKPREGAMALPGGGMVMMGEDEADSPEAQARKARRELDDRARERLHAILNAAQRDRLPKPRPEAAEGFAGEFVTQDAVIIRAAPSGP